tara:strand:- start:58 stop:327 length:270 start_codon:yes stop_codon:yes gene_type:complete
MIYKKKFTIMFKINGNIVIKILENVIKKINNTDKYTFNKIKNIILEELYIIKKNLYKLNEPTNNNIEEEEEEKPRIPIRNKNKRKKVKI